MCYNMKERIALNNDENQVFLWVACYPGITKKVFEEKQLDYELRNRVTPTLNSLVTKGYIKEDKGKWYAIKEMELPV